MSKNKKIEQNEVKDVITDRQSVSTVETNELTKKERRIISDERILSSAVEEFATKGYSNASLLSIAKKAGVSVGLVAQNFGCKELLFESVCKRNLQILMLAQKGNKKADWKERLYEIISKFKTDVQKGFVVELEFMRAALCSKDTPDAFNENFDSRFSESELCEAFKKGQRKGEIVKGNPGDVYRFFFKTVCNVILDCHENSVPFPEKEWFISLILKKKRTSSKPSQSQN